MSNIQSSDYLGMLVSAHLSPSGRGKLACDTVCRLILWCQIDSPEPSFRTTLCLTYIAFICLSLALKNQGFKHDLLLMSAWYHICNMPPMTKDDLERNHADSSA